MRVLHKKLLRTLKKSWGQSLAVIMVIVCGVACYICINSAFLNLSLTRDTYYTRERLADFEIMLDRAPATAVFKAEELQGVRQVRGRIVKDVNVDIENIDEPRIGRMISMPSPRRPVINDIVIVKGRYFDPGVPDEVVMSDRFALENGLNIGDRIQVSVETKKYSLRIVGLGLSPEYVYMIRNVQELLPSPERFGILWVPEDFAETALDMKEACNNIVGMADDPDDLDRILEEAEDLYDSYGVFAKLTRDEQVSARFLADEIKGLEVSSKVTPTIFLGIAALILLVLLNRMVRTERTQIGLMKAYGYSSFAVAFHYLEYALLLSLVGCVGGFFLGQWWAQAIIKVYVEFYQFPLLESRVYPEVLLESMGISCFFALLGASWSAVRAARIHPAESMRPESPKFAHQVWLEQFRWLWKRLTFTWKMIVRNISRNKFRAGLNIFGVAISTSLLIMGFFTIDSFNFGINFQFQEVQREDVRIGFQREQGKATYYDISRFKEVRYAEPILEYPFEIKAGWRKKDIVVTGLPADAQLQKIMTFKGDVIPVTGQGLVLSDRLARILGVSVGDEVTLKPLMGRIKKTHTVTVKRTAQQFLGTGAYMELGQLSRLLNESFAMTAVLADLHDGAEASLKKRLKDVVSVSAVGFNQDAFNSIMETLAASMYIMNFSLLIFAGIIAFSVIYNVTAVSLSERQRELASLRVMGLTTAEVGNILYQENFLLGILGIVAGVPMGIGLSLLIVKAYDTDLYRMPFHIENKTYVISVLLTLGFIVLANLAARRKIKRLDLIEVLKARE